MMVLKRLILLVSTAAGLFCSCDGKHFSHDVHDQDHGTGNTENLLIELDASRLVLSSTSEDNANSLIAHDVGQRHTVRARYAFSSSHSYKIHIAAIHQNLTDCRDSAESSPTTQLQSPITFSWDRNNRTKPSTVKLGDDFDVAAGEQATLIVDFDNKEHCNSIEIRFSAQGEVVTPSPSTAPSSDEPQSPPTPIAHTPDIPLKAGVRLIGRLSAKDGCMPTLTRTVGDMLFDKGQFGLDDAVKLTKVTHGDNLPDTDVMVQISHKASMIGLIEITGSTVTVPQIRNRLKAGSIVKFTNYSECAASSEEDPVYLIGTEGVSLEFSNKDQIENGGQQLATLEISKLSPNPFSVTYEYTSDHHSWVTTYKTTLAGDRLELLPENIHWAIYNKKSYAYITSWQIVPRENLVAGSLRIDDLDALHRLLPNQEDLDIVFDAEPSSRISFLKSRFVLSIGDYCRSFLPAYFKDLTNPGKRCYEVHDDDLFGMQ